jgi:hypothetical protein
MKYETGGMKQFLRITWIALLIPCGWGVRDANAEPAVKKHCHDSAATMRGSPITTSCNTSAPNGSSTNSNTTVTGNTMTNSHASLAIEFDRQVSNLVSRGYPALCGRTVGAFVAETELLKRQVAELSIRDKPGNIPFVIVVKQELVPLEAAMPLVNINGEAGLVNMVPVSPTDFSPIAGLEIPTNAFYLLENVDTGRSTLSIRPEDALKMIRAESRSPLTIDEGVALVVQYPQVLTDKNTYNCIQMPGSRRKDQRIPSLWISYGKPRLGWCWDRNKHTWLGCASCSRRLGTSAQ